MYNISGRVWSAESFRIFSIEFYQVIAKHIAPLHIKGPRNLKELRKLEKPYRVNIMCDVYVCIAVSVYYLFTQHSTHTYHICNQERGFPGAIGSMDGVQIAWEGCPFALKHHCTGKEGYPTLGFNVVVTHNLIIQHVTPVMAGRYNDKTKIRYDTFVQNLRSGKYDKLSYNVYSADGTVTKRNDVYVINDNGYHEWIQLMCPAKHTARAHLALWSERLEQVRKDSERTFGIMQKRFRILKLPVNMRDSRDVHNLFVTCCTFHNILVHRDKPFLSSTHTLYPNKTRTVLHNRTQVVLLANSNWAYMGHEWDEDEDDPDDVYEIERDNDFDRKRDVLAEHLFYMYRQHRLVYN